MTKYKKVTPEIAAQLQAIVGAKRFFAGDAVKDDFSHDEMPIYGKYYPEVVCEAESTEEVSAIMRVCYDNNIPVTPRGADRGQHVMIETPTSGVVRGAFAIYVMPIVTLIAGYLIAAALSLSEGVCILAAFGSAVLGVLIAMIISKKRHAADPTPTKIVSVIEKDE